MMMHMRLPSASARVQGRRILNSQWHLGTHAPVARPDALACTSVQDGKTSARRKASSAIVSRLLRLRPPLPSAAMHNAPSHRIAHVTPKTYKTRAKFLLGLIMIMIGPVPVRPACCQQSLATGHHFLFIALSACSKASVARCVAEAPALNSGTELLSKKKKKKKQKQKQKETHAK